MRLGRRDDPVGPGYDDLWEQLKAADMERARTPTGFRRVGSDVNPKAYVFLSLILGGVVVAPILSYRASAEKIDAYARASQARAQRLYEQADAATQAANVALDAANQLNEDNHRLHLMIERLSRK